MAIHRDRQLQQLRAAGERWVQRTAERELTERRLAQGGPVAAESPERLSAHIKWRDTIGRRSPLVAIERIVGIIDFVDRPPTPEAGVAARSVARIVTRPEPGFAPEGFGTGFLVAPGVLMTNNHVLASLDDVAMAAANFGHARVDGKVAPGTLHAFSANPNEFVTDQALDFTLVALTADPGMGHHPLFGTTGKILLGQPVSIIQHPRGGIRQYAMQNNVLVDLLPDFLHYTTDTEPGSSGSPAYNSHWEVVALHHQGVPRMRDGVIMARNGQPWDDRTMTDADIDWVANEGVRISRILEHLARLREARPNLSPFIDRVLQTGAMTAPEAVLPPMAPPPPVTVLDRSRETMSATTIHIHGPATIYTGMPSAAELPERPHSATISAPSTLDAAEGISIDPNYAGREGYVPSFLGNNMALPLPAIGQAMAAHIAPLKSGAADGILKYHHFSIVMHSERRLAIYTAVNIDGKKGKRPAREADKWFFDPRLERRYQIGEELYKANPLDRGHLVRRLDPAWGTLAVAKVANDDTFHFTNCSPQHSNLNQKIWAELEDYLLDHAQEDDVRLTVFTGPVFSAEDPTYRDVQLPRRFWKVAVMKDRQGRPLAAGFVQSQRKLVTGLKEADFLRQEMRTDQFKISQIEQLTGLTFHVDPQADALHGQPDEPIPEALGLIGHRLETLSDIVLR